MTLRRGKRIRVIRRFSDNESTERFQFECDRLRSEQDGCFDTLGRLSVRNMDNGQFTGILYSQLFCELLLQKFYGDGDCSFFRFILDRISRQLIGFILLRTHEGNVIDQLTLRFTDLCHDKLRVIRNRCGIREDCRDLNSI